MRESHFSRSYSSASLHIVKGYLNPRQELLHRYDRRVIHLTTGGIHYLGHLEVDRQTRLVQRKDVEIGKGRVLNDIAYPYRADASCQPGVGSSRSNFSVASTASCVGSAPKLNLFSLKAFTVTVHVYWPSLAMAALKAVLSNGLTPPTPVAPFSKVLFSLRVTGTLPTAPTSTSGGPRRRPRRHYRRRRQLGSHRRRRRSLQPSSATLLRERARVPRGSELGLPRGSELGKLVANWIRMLWWGCWGRM